MKMLKLLPEFKTMVLNNINSSINYAQLLVCYEMIELFRIRYTGFINIIELHKHMTDLTECYDMQMIPFFKSEQG